MIEALRSWMLERTRTPQPPDPSKALVAISGCTRRRLKGYLVLKRSPRVYRLKRLLQQVVGSGWQVACGRKLQAQEQLRTKVLQSFTPAPPERARVLSLPAFRPNLHNRSEVHEWRTKLSALRADPDPWTGSARARKRACYACTCKNEPSPRTGSFLRPVRWLSWDRLRRADEWLGSFLRLAIESS